MDDTQTHNNSNPAGMEALTIESVQPLLDDAQQATAKLPELFQCLKSGDEELRAWVSDALQTIENVPEQFAELLAQSCSSEIGPVASWACKLIPRLGAPALEYQDMLAAVLSEHPKMGVRQQAAAALGKFSTLNDTTLERVRMAAASDDPRLSRLASQIVKRQEAA